MSILKQSACLGVAPACTQVQVRVDREKLVYKLTYARNKIRVLVAPDGFGKTMLVANYAQTVFKFNQTFWIDLSSVQALQDLDSGNLYTSFKELSYTQGLIIFENYSFNLDERAYAMLALFEYIRDQGLEVIVTTTPRYAHLFDDDENFFVLRAQDLLVARDESKACAYGPFHDADELFALREYLPCAYAWGDADAQYRCLRGLISDIPKDILLFVFVVCALGKGNFNDVAAIVPMPKQKDIEFLELFFPHLGINILDESFECIPMTAAQLKKIFDDVPALESIFPTSERRDEIVEKVADFLISRKCFAPAGELIQWFCTKNRRLSWMLCHQRLFLSLGYSHTVLSIYGEIDLCGHDRALLGKTCAHLLAGNFEKSFDVAYQLAFCKDATEHNAALGFLIAALSKEDISERMKDIIHTMDIQGVVDSFGFTSQEMRENIHVSFSVLRDAILFVFSDAYKSIELIEDHKEELLRSPLGIIGMSAVILRAIDVIVHHIPPSQRTFERAARSLDGVLEEASGALSQQFSHPTIVAAHIYALRLKLREYVTLGNISIEKETQNLYETMLLRTKIHEADDAKSIQGHPKALSEGDNMKIHLQLFGGLRAYRKNVPIDMKKFSKHKAQILLAILALHKGKEVSRDRIIDAMWPRSNYDKALGNFYSVWSILKKAIADDAGNCPYLIKYQYGCMIDNKLVTSDIERFDAICSALMFGEVNAGAWLLMLQEVQRDFYAELLPSEAKLQFIIDARQQYVSKLSHALQKASQRLFELQQSEAALLFAQEAWHREKGNEQCCRTLMRAQLSCDMPTEAIRVYLDEMEWLRENFGVNPSQKTFDLYQEALVCSDGGLRDENPHYAKVSPVVW